MKMRRAQPRRYSAGAAGVSASAAGFWMLSQSADTAADISAKLPNHRQQMTDGTRWPQWKRVKRADG